MQAIPYFFTLKFEQGNDADRGKLIMIRVYYIQKEAWRKNALRTLYRPILVKLFCANHGTVECFTVS